jgi:indole-3-glycerol phosphate synthase
VSGFLEEMARGSRERARLALQTCPEGGLLGRALASPAPPRLRLDLGGFDLITELKLRSPASGRLQAASEENVGARVRAYAEAGAAAVSVLTEPSRFDGSLAHLYEAAAALTPSGVPVMRKDFLVEPCQLMEARLAGAGGVLVIVRMLSEESLGALLACARELGLFVLLEAFDGPDIERMHEVMSGGGDLLAGLNCRDLSTLQVVPDRLIELCPLLPATVPRVAESGVTSAADAARVAACGYELALVGSALMQAASPGELVFAMLREGRAARSARSCG